VNPDEIAALQCVERAHWFYRGKRDLVRHWLAALGPLGREDLLVDIGAGTGQFLLEMRPLCRTVGVEAQAHAAAIAAARSVPLARGAIEALPIRSGAATAVTALDVLEHVADDAGAARELARIARPGGIVIVHVPALARLWSDWDEALGHQRRYDCARVLALVRGAALIVRHCAYVNSLACLPILVARTLRTRFGLGAERRLEDHVPLAPLNHLLYWSFVAPGRWAWCSPPFGTSILCIAQKPAAAEASA
jgi:SAM-dependent methyltransferase